MRPSRQPCGRGSRPSRPPGSGAIHRPPRHCPARPPPACRSAAHCRRSSPGGSRRGRGRCRRCQPVAGAVSANSANTVRTRQIAAVPKNATRNHGLSTTMSIDCIAAIPCSGRNRPSAAITKAENAKKTPPISPHSSAAHRVGVAITGSVTASSPGFRRRMYHAGRGTMHAAGADGRDGSAGGISGRFPESVSMQTMQTCLRGRRTGVDWIRRAAIIEEPGIFAPVDVGYGLRSGG